MNNDFCGLRFRRRTVTPAAGLWEVIAPANYRRLAISISSRSAGFWSLWIGPFDPTSPATPFAFVAEGIQWSGQTFPGSVYFHYHEYGAFMQQDILAGFATIPDLNVIEMEVEEPRNPGGFDGPCYSVYSIRNYATRVIVLDPPFRMMPANPTRVILGWSWASSVFDQLYLSPTPGLQQPVLLAPGSTRTPITYSDAGPMMQSEIFRDQAGGAFPNLGMFEVYGVF